MRRIDTKRYKAAFQIGIAPKNLAEDFNTGYVTLWKSVQNLIDVINTPDIGDAVRNAYQSVWDQIDNLLSFKVRVSYL